MAGGEPADVGDLLGTFDLGDVADGEEDAGFGQRVHHHVEEAGEIGERAAHAEGERDDAHVLDRRVGEHPFDVAPPVEHEACEDERGEPHGHHQRAGRQGTGVPGEQDLEAEDRV